MSKTSKNLITVLGLITVAVAGYYVFTQQSGNSVTFRTNEAELQNMLANTQVFVQRRQQLEQIKLDITFFEDERFRSLRSFTQPVREQPIGRPDPFAEAARSDGNSSN